MERPEWAPADVAVDRPSPARMYDALLGGSHNFQVDRDAVARAVSLVPDLRGVAVSNRAFLRRVVRFLVDAGVRQFVDFGAGIPTVGNTHEIARQIDPECRVAYVDIDPVAVAHARAILGDDPRTVAFQGDVRAPGRLLADPRVRDLIDFAQPVAVLLIAVLHLLTDDDDPGGVVTAIRAALPAGSYVAISHLTSEGRPEDAAKLGANAAQRTRVPIIFRSREAITGFFDGLAVVEPGVVELPLWRPDTPVETAARSLGLAGVGRIRRRR